ncbi:MAG: YggS family pyridoxal phosphate-dependent enzyme [Myxococcota bacterium]
MARREMSHESIKRDIEEKLGQVRARIEAACARAGRNPSSVTLIGVVKTFGPEVVRAAYDAGLRHFGESYAQDLRDKTEVLSDLPDVHWHFIGRLQTNKVRYLAGKVELVHALDRMEAALALSKRLERMDLAPLDVLISVNLGGESSKSGVAEHEL